MSTGGVFQLITNDGKQDRMLMATDLLRARLARIMQARSAAGLDPTPTLVDIEKTHVLFMNSHFKPFAAIGYEYNKVQPSSGTVTLNSTVQFSIPQFGDFFHDMVLHVRLGVVTASTVGNTWRWCAYPGERLLDKVRFTVNGNPLDEYYGQDYNFYRKLELAPSKRAGYDSCAGQQQVKLATIIPGAPGGTSGLSGPVNGTAGSGSFGVGPGTATTATPFVSSGALFKCQVTTGYQTVKTGTAHSTTSLAGANYRQTDLLEVTMPLLFWFNRDPRLAIPSVSIPFGQRFIEIDLTPLTNLCGGVVVTGSASTTPSVSTGATLSISSTQVPTCNLYVNNIFVNPEVHDIFIKRIGFNLIRVHRRQVNRISTGTVELLLNNFKWPIETIAFGFRAAQQATAPTVNSAWGDQYADGWHMFASSLPVTTGMTTGTSNLGAQWLEQAPLVQSVSFTAHGIPIYNDLPALLYNQYFPFAFGDRLQTPDDIGCYVVTFNLYPGLYQPSGHLNVSRAREFYIKFTDVVPTNARQNACPNVDSIGGTNNSTTDFMSTATAINFLLISDGSAVLRYST